MIRSYLFYVFLRGLQHGSFALTQSAISGMRSGGLERNGNLAAVILRGEPFHDHSSQGGGGCAQGVYDEQLLAAKSLMDMIISPLQRQYKEVHVFVTSNGHCDKFKDVVRIYQSTRAIVKMREINEECQEGSIRAALEWFKTEAGQIDMIQEQYGLVIMTRHDLHWLVPINAWPAANFSRFNFFARAEPAWPDRVLDHFHMMPGKMFGIFDRTVGERKCWSMTFCNHGLAGHDCKQQLDRDHYLNPEQIGFITDWRPKDCAREDSDVMRWMKEDSDVMKEATSYDVIRRQRRQCRLSRKNEKERIDVGAIRLLPTSPVA